MWLLTLGAALGVVSSIVSGLAGALGPAADSAQGETNQSERESLLRRTLLKVIGAAALACVVVPLATAAHAEVPAAHTAAKPKPNSEGNGAGGAATGKHHDSSGSGAQSGSDEAGLATNIVHDVHGGYVASGVGLRNRGSGNIVLGGIPSRATVTKAYLYWNILGGSTPGSNFSVGRIGRTQIRGAFLGQGDSPCWAV